ncbi:MAG: enoyl-CoA hydratase/isomerase family protein [Cyanobacteria bacterium]|nr:enoyl-CoA hydratase/isomerase family protein [Cyanobacteriota bacterium]
MAPEPKSFQSLRYDLQDSGVLTITLNRPDCLNAFDDTLSFEVQEALKQAERDAKVRCIILTGAGRGFCAGQDLQSRSIASQNGDTPHLGESIRKRYAPIISKLRTLEKPVIAMVNGVAAGAGASIAFACDLRISSDKASFIQAFVKVGLIPDSGACWLLPRLVGMGRAMHLAMTGEKIDAETALQYGMVNAIYPVETLASETLKLAESFAQGPTQAFGLIKRAMNKGQESSLDEFLSYEADLQEVAGRTQDFKEGVSAFVEKRAPQFTGR